MMNKNVISTLSKKICDAKSYKKEISDLNQINILYQQIIYHKLDDKYSLYFNGDECDIILDMDNGLLKECPEKIIHFIEYAVDLEETYNYFNVLTEVKNGGDISLLYDFVDPDEDNENFVDEEYELFMINGYEKYSKYVRVLGLEEKYPLFCSKK